MDRTQNLYFRHFILASLALLVINIISIGLGGIIISLFMPEGTNAAFPLASPVPLTMALPLFLFASIPALAIGYFILLPAAFLFILTRPIFKSDFNEQMPGRIVTVGALVTTGNFIYLAAAFPEVMKTGLIDSYLQLVIVNICFAVVFWSLVSIFRSKASKLAVLWISFFLLAWLFSYAFPVIFPEAFAI